MGEMMCVKSCTYSIFLAVALICSNQTLLFAQESSGASWENLAKQELAPATTAQQAAVQESSQTQESSQLASTTTTEAEATQRAPAVDILDESLKFHNNMGTASMPMGAGLNGAITDNTNQMGAFAAGNMMNGANANLVMQQNMMQQNMMQQSMMQQGAYQNMMPMMQQGMNGQTVMYPPSVPCTINVFQTPVQQQQPDLAQSLLGVDSKTVGVVGATALMGAFMQSGGVGGALRSAGWDNHRHIRGQSIGGY